MGTGRGPRGATNKGDKFRGKARGENMRTNIAAKSIAREVARQAYKLATVKPAQVPKDEFKRMADNIYRTKRVKINNLLDQVVKILLREDME